MPTSSYEKSSKPNFPNSANGTTLPPSLHAPSANATGCWPLPSEDSMTNRKTPKAKPTAPRTGLISADG